MRTLAKLTLESIGKEVMLCGWVHARRDHGKIAFLDLRDRSGIVQLVIDSGNPKDSRNQVEVQGQTLKEKGLTLSAEDVVEVRGVVKKRPENLINPKIETGTVEVEVTQLSIISKSHELPFPIDTDGYDINEEARLKYRYLDIRRPRMTHNLRLRSAVTTYIRNFLAARDFVEVETPMLTKTTPEGARDFLVPSRLQKGKFYALPQSPQQYKQLLMVAGLERYFQIVRCFRDEDPRHDRAYGEFTQLDLEMSFITQEDILLLAEELFASLVGELFPQKWIKQSPWPRIPHREAIAKYGTDKPDLRRNKKDPDELAFAWTVDFPLFTKQSEEDFYYGSGKAKFAPSHHMFTSPHPDDVALLDTDPMKVRGLQHDLILNGYEVGGGSVRIHDPKIQAKIFDLIGFSQAQKDQFQHMLTAFTYGVPPHGGIAPGIDRFLMAALGEPSVREVMAFPTAASGRTSVMDAPGEATQEQLDELGITVASNNASAFDKIITLLKKHKVKFQLYEHEPVYTSEDAAKIRGTDLSFGAKALVLFADGKPIMVAVAGDRKIDFSSFKKLYKIKDLRMATKEEVLNVTGVPIGAVPPYGSIFGIPLYEDDSIHNNESMAYNAGLHTKSISMNAADFERIEKPIVGNFSKALEISY